MVAGQDHYFSIGARVKVGIVLVCWYLYTYEAICSKLLNFDGVQSFIMLLGIYNPRSGDSYSIWPFVKNYDMPESGYTLSQKRLSSLRNRKEVYLY